MLKLFLIVLILAMVNAEPAQEGLKEEGAADLIRALQTAMSAHASISQYIQTKNVESEF